MAAQETNLARLWRDLTSEMAALPMGDPRIEQLQTQLQQLQRRVNRNRLVFRDVVQRPAKQKAKDALLEINRLPQRKLMKETMEDLRVMPQLGYFPGGEETRSAAQRHTGLFRPDEPLPYMDPVPKMGPKTMGYLLKDASGQGKPKKCRKCGLYKL
jgi:hypothetical protein